MSLPVLKQRAIALLSTGTDATSVAQQLHISRMTLCRWKREKAFVRALNRSVGELMANVNNQVQNTARVFIEGGLDCANELRHIVLKVNATDHDKRLAAAQMLKHVQRFWDLLGYNMKCGNPQKLLNEELDQYDDAESIETGPPKSKHERKSKDRLLNRPISEIDPPPPGAVALAQPKELHEWGTDPINEDGTPKTPPSELEAAKSAQAKVPAKRAKRRRKIKTVAARYNPHAAFKRPTPRKPRKAWKRSRTTLRAGSRVVRSSSLVSAGQRQRSNSRSSRVLNTSAHAVCSPGGSPGNLQTSATQSSAHGTG